MLRSADGKKAQLIGIEEGRRNGGVAQARSARRHEDRDACHDPRAGGRDRLLFEAAFGWESAAEVPDHAVRPKTWRWVKHASEVTSRGGGIWHLIDGRDRERATIWQNSETLYTWHTWDEGGTGGENAEAATLDDAKLFCVGCVVRQGWAPGGWEVHG